MYHTNERMFEAVKNRVEDAEFASELANDNALLANNKAEQAKEKADQASAGISQLYEKVDELQSELSTVTSASTYVVAAQLRDRNILDSSFVAKDKESGEPLLGYIHSDTDQPTEEMLAISEPSTKKTIPKTHKYRPVSTKEIIGSGVIAAAAAATMAVASFLSSSPDKDADTPRQATIPLKPLETANAKLTAHAPMPVRHHNHPVRVPHHELKKHMTAPKADHEWTSVAPVIVATTPVSEQPTSKQAVASPSHHARAPHPTTQTHTVPAQPGGFEAVIPVNPNEVGGMVADTSK